MESIRVYDLNEYVNKLCLDSLDELGKAFFNSKYLALYANLRVALLSGFLTMITPILIIMYPSPSMFIW